jgi:hypothetical protein
MHTRLPFILTAAALVFSACGGAPATTVGGTTDQSPTAGGAGDAPVSDEAAASESAGNGVDVDSAGAGDGADQPAVVTTQEAAANAEANEPNLAATDNVLDTEVLIVADGSITTLAEAATGDRPLLVWFWAPH